MRHTFEYLLARMALASIELTPRRVSETAAEGYAAWLDLALPKLRRTAYRNLAMALPDADSKAIVDGVFRSIARLLVSFARFPKITRANVREWIQYEGFEHYEEAKRRGRGVLFATAHLGNWELSAFAHALLTEPMSVVVRPLDNPRIDSLVEARRSLSGNSIIEKRDAARAILRALERNQAVGVLIDQNASLAEGTFVDFFGVPACANTAFAKLAGRSGAAVIPGFALWSETHQRYTLRFYPIQEMTGDAAADTASLHKLLERIIRDYPDQWLWIHRRWKTRPPGEPAIYPR